MHSSASQRRMGWSSAIREPYDRCSTVRLRAIEIHTYMQSAGNRSGRSPVKMRIKNIRRFLQFVIWKIIMDFKFRLSSGIILISL